MPMTRNVTAFLPAPFHSFRIIPHTLLKTTFKDIRMLQENAIITLPGSKKLCPIPNPKNWEYQSKPAKAQKRRLLTSTDLDVFRISPLVLFRGLKKEKLRIEIGKKGILRKQLHISVTLFHFISTGEIHFFFILYTSPEKLLE